MFAVRFDMRAPQPGAAPADLYRAAVEMCTWAETRGCAAVVLCEHHASPDGSIPGMREAYEAAARTAGHEPGYVGLPDRNEPSVVFVAEDVDHAWYEIGAHLLHDAQMCSSWNPGDDTTAMISHASTVDELRATSAGYRIMSVAEATEHLTGGDVLRLAPLCGGIPPDVAWPYLERAATITAA